MRKKFLALMLSLSMVASLASCGGSGSKPASNGNAPAASAGTADEADLSDIIPDKTVTLTVFDQLANYSGEQVGWFGKMLLDKFNVKLNIVPDPEGQGVFETRMEAGDLGDIVIFGKTDQYRQAIKQNLLWEWNDEDLLTDYGPYIKEHMDIAIQKNKDMNNGSCYGVGNDIGSDPSDIKSFDYHPDIRYDLYQQIGSPKISTLEDYEDVLAKMVKVCPKSDSGKQTYGVSLFPDWDGDMVMFVKATAALYGWDEFGIGLYNVNDQTYQGALDDNSIYLRCLKFYNDLYQKGLLDPDSSTQTFDNVSEDYTDGAAFFNIFEWMGAKSYNTGKHLSEGKAMLAVPCEDEKPLVYGCNIYGNTYQIGIGANTEYPELCMAIINWLSTPEGNMEAQYGPKDLCWNYDENGKTVFTELGSTCNKDENTKLTGGEYTGTFKDGKNQLCFNMWDLDAENPDSNGETFNDLKWESELNSDVSDIEQKWRDATGKSNANEYLASRPYSLSVGTDYTKTEQDDDLTIVWNQVTTCVKQYSWKAIYAKSDDEYNKIVAEMKKKANEYGYDQCQKYQKKEAEIRKQAEDKVKELAK